MTLDNLITIVENLLTAQSEDFTFKIYPEIKMDYTVMDVDKINGIARISAGSFEPIYDLGQATVTMSVEFTYPVERHNYVRDTLTNVSKASAGLVIQNSTLDETYTGTTGILINYPTAGNYFNGTMGETEKAILICFFDINEKVVLANECPFYIQSSTTISYEEETITASTTNYDETDVSVDTINTQTFLNKVNSDGEYQFVAYEKINKDYTEIYNDLSSGVTYTLDIEELLADFEENSLILPQYNTIEFIYNGTDWKLVFGGSEYTGTHDFGFVFTGTLSTDDELGITVDYLGWQYAGSVVSLSDYGITIDTEAYMLPTAKIDVALTYGTQGTYYTRSGSGTEEDPYVYTEVTLPADYVSGTTYYEKVENATWERIKFYKATITRHRISTTDKYKNNAEMKTINDGQSIDISLVVPSIRDSKLNEIRGKMIDGTDLQETYNLKFTDDLGTHTFTDMIASGDMKYEFLPGEILSYNILFVYGRE